MLDCKKNSPAPLILITCEETHILRIAEPIGTKSNCGAPLYPSPKVECLIRYSDLNVHKGHVLV